METVNILDFEVNVGTNVIELPDIKKALDFWPFGHKYRVYLLLLMLSLRPSEPNQLTWHNFLDGMLIFRPQKQNSRRVIRKIKIPPKIWHELEHYRINNYFLNEGHLFDFKPQSFRRLFNKDFRLKIGGNWSKYSDNLREGRVSRFYYYTLQSFRTTAATLLYHYYSLVYGNGDVALSFTCSQLGHSNRKITAEYYIKRVSALKLDKCPKLSYLELLDYMAYHDTQFKLEKFIKKDRQRLLYE